MPSRPTSAAPHSSVAAARHVVARPRLVDRLRGGPRATNEPVVLLSGAAGTGKSVVLQQWLDLDDREHLEVPVARGLDDPEALVRALVEALEPVGPPAPAMGTPSGEADDFAARVLPGLGGLVASRAADYVLVVDDVHLLHDPRCGAVLRTVCDAMPSGSQVVLVSRDVAPTWLARTRAGGRLKEIGPHELRLDATEAAALLGVSHVGPAEPRLSDLLERTEGWAVALYLTVLANWGADGTAEEDARRFIDDYVSTEVMGALDPELSAFAVRTSVLDELTPDLCDAVLERDDSAAVLARLRGRLQLLAPVRPGADHLRHPLVLRDALRAELTRSAPSEPDRLHLRASRWYAAHGDLDRAIRHAKAAKALPEVSRLVWAGTAGCVGSGSTPRLARWLDGLSDAQVEHDRWLTLSAAWAARLTGDTDRTVRLVLRAEGHAGPGWRHRVVGDEYAAAVAVLVAAVSRRSVADVQGLCETSVRGLPPDSGFRAVALFLRAVTLALRRDVERATEVLREAEGLSRALQAPVIQADALAWQAVLALRAGDTQGARRLLAQARQVVAEHGLDDLAPTAHLLTAQALAEALDNDGSARTTLTAALDHPSWLTDELSWFAVVGRLLQARAAVALGDPPLGRRLVIEARARMTRDLAGSLAADLLDDAENALSAATVGGLSVPTLSAAETRVLQFLPSHLQLADVADQLFLSRNTVKTHITAIYRKLGVTSRGQAVARARELGLLDPVRPSA